MAFFLGCLGLHFDGLDNDCDGKVDEEICEDFKGKRIMSVDWW